ncbi:MAG: alpha/beta hydrolase [Candidatus Rokuibacteriota bacterium]
MPYIETPDGLPLHYLDEGPRASPPIVLIHGEPCSAAFWRRNIPELSRRHRVVAVDIRGRGESGKTEDGHTIVQYARDLRHVLQALVLRDVVVVGWSLGGSIVWSYLQQFTDDGLAGYVNVDQRAYRFVSDGHLQAQVSAIRTRRLRHHTELIRHYLGPEAGEDDEVVRWMTYECMKTPTEAHCAAITDSYHADYRPFLPQVRLPTRIFWARYGLIPPETATAMAGACRRAQLVFFEHSGHLLQWTEPEKFNTELLTFTREVLPGG